MEVRINKEVRDYQEAMCFGLNLRQFIFSLLAVLVAVGLYFGLRDVFGQEEIGWMCILGAAPFAGAGFFRYHGMNAEQFLRAYIRSEFRYPPKLMFRAENLYAWRSKTHNSRRNCIVIKSLQKLQRQDKERFVVPKSVQQSIPIRRIWPDGIFQVGNKFSKSIRFADINYAIASKEDKTEMFLDYSQLLNALDAGSTAKITIHKPCPRISVLNERKMTGLQAVCHLANK